MNKIICELRENNSLHIAGLPLDNQRKLTKIKIFLNPNHLLTYKFIDDCLEVQYTIDDKTVIAKETEKIIKFIENIFATSISMDNNAKESIEERISKVSNFNFAINKLREIKD